MTKRLHITFVYICLLIGVTASASDLDPLYERVKSLSNDDIWTAITLCEGAIKEYDGDPTLDRFYLLLGKMKQKSQMDVREPYYLNHKEEYFYNELGGNYIYVGTHFDVLIKNFPESEFRDDAAYEKTMRRLHGECEGDTPCFSSRVFSNIRPFLERFPNSDFVMKAIERTNDVIEADIAGVTNMASEREYFSPGNARSLLASYRDVLPPLPVEAQASANAMMAPFWVKLLDYDSARVAYEFVRDHSQDPEMVAEVTEILDTLPSAPFVADAPKVISFDRVDLSWTPPVSYEITRYEIYRTPHRIDERREPSRSPGSYNIYRTPVPLEEELIGTTPPEVTTFIDDTPSPSTYYTYRIKFVTQDYEQHSNILQASTSDTLSDVELMYFDRETRVIYQFRIPPEQAPEVRLISETGQLIERVRAAMFGVPGASFNRQWDVLAESILLVDLENRTSMRFDKGEPSVIATLHELFADLKGENLDDSAVADAFVWPPEGRNNRRPAFTFHIARGELLGATVGERLARIPSTPAPDPNRNHVWTYISDVRNSYGAGERPIRVHKTYVRLGPLDTTKEADEQIAAIRVLLPVNIQEQSRIRTWLAIDPKDGSVFAWSPTEGFGTLSKVEIDGNVVFSTPILETERTITPSNEPATFGWEDVFPPPPVEDSPAATRPHQRRSRSRQPWWVSQEARLTFWVLLGLVVVYVPVRFYFSR